ncbi:MAG: DUF401 family protein [Fibrobacteres bacterium]|nr:DUF401 family protein [Fibrobacterota bacterium]
MPFELPYALIKVIAIFAIIVATNRFSIDLGLSIIIGTFALGLIFGLPVSDTLTSMALSVTEPLTIMLTLLVTLILVLNQLMGKSGAQQSLVNHLSKLANNAKISLFSLPALIGLLPMPGGAYFSAPMVEEVSKDLPVTQEWRVLVNYWFRHIWEFWWPMYPGVILAVSLSGLSFSKYMAMMFVFTPFAVAIGYLLLLKPLKLTKPAEKESADLKGRILSFLYHALPVTLILIVMAIFTAAAPLWKTISLLSGSMAQYFPMFAGLIVSGAWVYFKGKLKPMDAIGAIFNKKTLMLILLIVAVMAYKKVLLDCGAITKMNEEMQLLEIPLNAVVIILPLIAGLVMGIAVGFVGASFPVILGLIPDNGSYTAYIVLAYMSGYVGMMISPIHMCLVLTRNHFTGSRMGPLYSRLVLLCGSVFVFGVLYAAVVGRGM